MKPVIEQSLLSNGLPVITVNLPAHTTATVLMLVRAGLYFESESTNGLSHFLEHVCFKGTKNWDGKALMRHLDGLGAETNAFTAEEFTGYYAKGSFDHWQKYVASVADIYLNPIFPNEEIIKERGVVAGEYDMYQDQPTYQAQTLLAKTMFGNQPAGWQILGPKKNITRFTKEHVQSWHDTHYQAKNSALVVVGPLNHKQVVTYAETLLAGARKGKKITAIPVIDSQSTMVVKAQTAQTDQSHICIGFKGYKKGDPKRHIAQMLASILGAGMSSRLFVKLREDMGAGYYVSASHAAYKDHGYLELRCGTEHTRVTEVVTALLNECARLTTELVTDEELQKVKNYLTSHSNMGLESSDAWAEFVGIQYITEGAIQTLEQKLAKINAVTAKDICDMAKKWLIKDNITAIVYGNNTNEDLRKGIKNSELV